MFAWRIRSGASDVLESSARSCRRTSAAGTLGDGRVSVRSLWRSSLDWDRQKILCAHLLLLCSPGPRTSDRTNATREAANNVAPSRRGPNECRF